MSMFWGPQLGQQNRPLILASVCIMVLDRVGLGDEKSFGKIISTSKDLSDKYDILGRDTDQNLEYFHL